MKRHEFGMKKLANEMWCLKMTTAFPLNSSFVSEDDIGLVSVLTLIGKVRSARPVQWSIGRIGGLT